MINRIKNIRNKKYLIITTIIIIIFVCGSLLNFINKKDENIDVYKSNQTKLIKQHEIVKDKENKPVTIKDVSIYQQNINFYEETKSLSIFVTFKLEKRKETAEVSKLDFWVSEEPYDSLNPSLNWSDKEKTIHYILDNGDEKIEKQIFKIDGLNNKKWYKFKMQITSNGITDVFYVNKWSYPPPSYLSYEYHLSDGYYPIEFKDPRLISSQNYDLKISFKLKYDKFFFHNFGQNNSIDLDIYNNGKLVANENNIISNEEISNNYGWHLIIMKIPWLRPGTRYNLDLRVYYHIILKHYSFGSSTYEPTEATFLFNRNFPTFSTIDDGKNKKNKITKWVNTDFSIEQGQADYEYSVDLFNSRDKIKSIKVFSQKKNPLNSEFINDKELYSSYSSQSNNLPTSGNLSINNLQLEYGKTYFYFLEVDTELDGITIGPGNFVSLHDAELPTINSVNVTALSSTTAKVDYKLSIPSSPIHKPTTISSIKVFNNGKEIASAPNTNLSGTIQIDGLTPGKDYTFELRVDSNAGLVKKNSNKITTPLEGVELPTINSVKATALSSTTAKVDYKLSLPSSSTHQPTTIKSIKVFNDGKEIASAPNTNLSGTIQIDGLTPGKDYTFELRVDSNAGLVKKNSNKITTPPLASVELPIINSFNATALSSTTAKVDYKLSIPSSPIHKPTTISSIKVFNNGKEIASSPNTNLSGTIRIDELTPGKDYTFELRVDSNAGLVKKNSNKITTPLEGVELPTINSVNATVLSSTTVEVDYKLTIPSSPTHQPTTIKSIKVFNNGKEIASAPNTNLSGTIQIDGLTPGKDYTFELRVDSNAGLCIKDTKELIIPMDSMNRDIFNKIIIVSSIIGIILIIVIIPIVILIFL